MWLGYRKPCGCLGSLTQALDISEQVADSCMKVALCYLLVGSYATLFWLLNQARGAQMAPTVHFVSSI